MAGLVQIIEFKTSRIKEIVMWEATPESVRTTARSRTWLR